MQNKYVLALVVAAGVAMSAQSPPMDAYKSVAEQYVKLVLAVGQYDADYVDAYYGPPEWKKEVEGARTSLSLIDSKAAETEKALAAITFKPAPKDAEMWTLRKQYLTRQLA